MNRDQASRLKPGDRVIFCRSRHGMGQIGEVVHATSNGGIQIIPIGPSSNHAIDDEPRPGTPLEWIHFGHVQNFFRQGKHF